MLALLQAEKGYTFLSVRFMSPLAQVGGKVEWQGEYEPRGRAYLYKCSPEFGDVMPGDLVVVPAKNSFAVAQVELVEFLPPSDHDFTFNIRQVVSRIDRKKVDEMKRAEDDAMRRMARAEASQKLAELRKHFDFANVDSLLSGKNSDVEVTE